MTHISSINITTVPHKNQKYDTAGDFGDGKNGWWMRVSMLPDWRYEALIVLHELTEMIVTRNDGVSWLDIDEFDRFGEGKNHPDPGSLESAPYHKQHMFAEQIEKMVAERLGVDWDKYNEALDALEF